MSPPESSSNVRPRGPGRLAALPAVDERLVMPETRYEVIDGKVEYVAPSDEPHGSRHSKVSALLEAYVAEGYDVASDMLTRTAGEGDMAPDASVFPAARDPETGGRQLEELAFEVVSTERLSNAARKARELSRRGVRRVFAIDVERRRALAWSQPAEDWEVLPSDHAIEDRALALPLPVHALVEAAKADDAMARALLAKKNPVLEAALAEAQLEGQRRTLLKLLASRFGALPEATSARILAADQAQLDTWLERVLTASTLADALDDT